MSFNKTPISLNAFFRRQSVKWSLIGLCLTMAFAIPCLIYTTKLGAERLVHSDARSVAYSFREKVLEGGIRDAQFQMRKALGLSDGESAIIRDPELRAIYPIGDSDKASHFARPGTYAWAPYFQTVSTLLPIYFGDETLFGYLELTRKPNLEWPLLGFLAVAILVAFSIQSFGLVSALRSSSATISSAVAIYADQIKNFRNRVVHSPNDVSFSEFSVMQASVVSLYSEIELLQFKTAQQAKESAQYSILREVTHDLKTPLSQLAKFQLIAFDKIRKHQLVEEIDLTRMERALRRASELVRQVTLKHQPPRGKAAPASWDLARETRAIVDDLQHLEDIEIVGISLELLSMTTVPSITMSRTEYYQILENLVRNAAEAISYEASDGRITVSLTEENGGATLRVSDNGPGIPENLKDSIFDFDVTTKVAHGTGVGLGIVRRICEQYSATIGFSSTTRGTTFTVHFPIETVSGLTNIRQYEESKQYESKV